MYDFCLQECCFEFGWGSGMVPCCLRIVSCDEHDIIVAENQRGNQMLGGGRGKTSVCPKNAAEARLMWEMANNQRITGNYLKRILIYILYN